MSAKSKRRRRKRYHVSVEAFVRVWQAGDSAKDVSEKLGLPLPLVTCRVWTYRRRGIRLKKMPRRNPRKLDVEILNRLAEACLSR